MEDGWGLVGGKGVAAVGGIGRIRAGNVAAGRTPVAGRCDRS